MLRTPRTAPTESATPKRAPRRAPVPPEPVVEQPPVEPESPAEQAVPEPFMAPVEQTAIDVAPEPSTEG